MWVKVKKGKQTTQVNTMSIIEMVQANPEALVVTLTLVDGSTRVYTPDSGAEWKKFLEATGAKA